MFFSPKINFKKFRTKCSYTMDTDFNIAIQLSKISVYRRGNFFRRDVNHKIWVIYQHYDAFNS